LTPPRSTPPPKFDSTGFFPAHKADTGEQVRVHHEVLHRHGRQFSNTLIWLSDMHRRVSELEKNNPKAQIDKIRGAVWVLMLLWPLVVAAVTHWVLK
jgi:hypothetical protein